MSAARGRDATPELTEVRTVLGRAESAVKRLDWLASVDRSQYGDDYFDPSPDVDLLDMLAALRVVIASLERWRKTGRTLNRTGRAT